MDKHGRAYEPPKMKIYWFDDNEKLLTASGGDIKRRSYYAADALNQYMDVTSSTTIE